MLSFFIIHVDVWYIASHMQSQACLNENRSKLERQLLHCMQLSYTKGAFQKVSTGQLNLSFKKVKRLFKEFLLKNHQTHPYYCRN